MRTNQSFRQIWGSGFLAILLLACALAFAPLGQRSAWAGAGNDKVALVIANGRYQAVEQLPNAVADGRLVSKALALVGFKNVVVLENSDRATMEKALRAFSEAADGASVAVVYYAGHGMEIGGANYLVPVDARLRQDRDVEIETVKLDTVLQMSDGAKRLRVVILDACRNNPFLVTMKRSIGTRAVAGGGLAPIEPKTDSLVVYSAKAGATATDGDGANSPFALALARRLVEPGREINILFRQVRDDVLRDTRGQQEPFTYGSLSHEEFYFVPGALRGAAVLDVESEAWVLCRDAASRGPCDAYLRRYAKGRFAGLAGTRIADLSTPPRPSVAAPASLAIVSSPAVQAVSRPLATASVETFGFSVQDEGAGVRVRSVDPRGLAAGELFVSDEILAIDTAKPAGSSEAAGQIGQAVRERGRVKLLIRRGPTTAVVVLRRPG